MSVYHITYTPDLNEICLYFNGECQFSCHGCISDWHPQDCHLEKSSSSLKQQGINIDKVIAYLNPISFKRIIFLGKEPTVDPDFFSLAKTLKEKFNTYNILLTNGWKYVEEYIDEVCVSIKAVTPQIFKDFTGKDTPYPIMNNFRKYHSFNLKVRAESIFIPEFIDKDEIEKIAKFITSIDSTIPYRIDGYIPYQNDKFRKPTKAEMEEAKKISEKYLKNVSILHYGINVKYKVKRVY